MLCYGIIDYREKACRGGRFAQNGRPRACPSERKVRQAMKREFFLFYTEANIVCILLFGILLLNDRISMNKQEKQLIFDRALVAHILYFFSDIFWAGVISGFLARTRFAVAILNFSNFVLLSAIAYEWALFAAASERLSFLSAKRGKFWFRLPFVGMTVVMVAAYLIAPRFWISQTGELNVLYYPLMLLAPLSYVGYSCWQSLRTAKRAADPAERRSFRVIGLYPLSVVFFGVSQLAFINAPMFCFGCTTMMLFFYVRLMNDQISLDPLTKINNRGQMLRYAAQESAHRPEGLRTFVIMADANDFKTINDNYGHAEGDRALVLIADTFKRCSRAIGNSYCLSRFGGDEFALIVHAAHYADVERMIEELHRMLADACVAAQIPYPVSVSVGYDEWSVGVESFHDSLERADAKLYEVKKRRKESAAAAT